MDINEFIKQVQPRAKRSKLDPFRAHIFELRGLGYANWQIRDWLATNGIKVTQESVRKFVVTRESTNLQSETQKNAESVNQTGPEIRAVLMGAPPVAGNGKTTAPEVSGAALSLKQRREKRADQFIKPENTNPVLKNLAKKKDP